MSKRLKLSAAAYRRLKATRVENLTKYAGFTVAYVKKAERKEQQMTRKVANG